MSEEKKSFGGIAESKPRFADLISEVLGGKVEPLTQEQKDSVFLSFKDKENEVVEDNVDGEIRPLSDKEKEVVAKASAEFDESMWDDHSITEILKWAADRLSGMGSVEPLMEVENGQR